jgi:hypothetical protein
VNDIASMVAFGFVARKLDFGFCDMVTNNLGPFVDRGDPTADLF